MEEEKQRQESLAAEASEKEEEGVRLMQQQHVAGRLRRLEEQFRRVQELMGFVDIGAVVDRVLEQQQVCSA